MDYLRKRWRGEQPYEPIEDGSATEGDAHDHDLGTKQRFSYVEYTIFTILGVCMLWAWNMFLAAAPYFQQRFKSNEWIFHNFQAAEISVSTIAGLGSMLVLTRLQAHASYPKRIISSLVINIAVFSLLALSTSVFVGVTAKGYFGFLLVMMLTTSLATGLCQNGVFAYVAGFAEPRYTQGIMTGQAIAGVLPCIAQIVSVLSVEASPNDPKRSNASNNDSQELPGTPPVPGTAALAYFLTATAVALIGLASFVVLLARRSKPEKTQDNSIPDVAVGSDDKKSVPMIVLVRKLFWLAGGVFITFGITMVFPVFTQQIVSVRPPTDQPVLMQPPSFIPLAFLFWNIGDLLGRLMTAVPTLSLVLRPRLVFALAISRIVFVGLYHLCNIGGRGAIINSDFFYLVVVQLFFGLSNGYLGSICMMGANEWVGPDEREAAGGFMGLSLVAGLAVGSLLSFFAGGS